MFITNTMSGFSRIRINEVKQVAYIYLKKVWMSVLFLNLFIKYDFALNVDATKSLLLEKGIQDIKMLFIHIAPSNIGSMDAALLQRRFMRLSHN